MRTLLAGLLLLAAPVSAEWNKGYDPAYVGKVHAALRAPLVLDVVCAGGVIGGCSGGGAAVGGASTLQFNDNVQLFFGTGSDTSIEYNATQTPDAWFFGVGTDSRGIVVAEIGDRAFDFAHAQQTNPTLFVHSATQSTTQWISLTHNATNGVIDVGTGSVNFLDGVNFATGTFVVIPNDGRFQLGTNNGQIAPITAQTPDSPVLATGTLANAFKVIEAGDIISDFSNGPGGTAALTQPGVIVHSQTVSATQYTAVQAGAMSTQRRRTLTEAGGAEELFRITTATLASGGGEIDYKIHATDGTDFAVRAGKIRFVFYNNAGTVTATISGADETADGSVAIVSAGETLTYALTVNVATANVFIFLINIDSNITVNAAHADYIVTYNGPGEVVFP